MQSTVRLVTFGALGGILLSVLRAPLGLDLLTAPAVEGTTAYAFRAAALLALGLSIGGASLLRAGVPTIGLLASVLLGYGVHGLLLDAVAPLGTRLGFAISFAVLVLALFVVGRAPASQPTEDGHEPRDGRGVRLGLLLGGAAAAIALETVARPLRQLGLGLPADDTAFGIALLGFVLFGAVAFRRLLPVERHGAIVAALGLGATTLACIVGARRLGAFESANALGAFVKSVGSLFFFADAVSSVLRVDLGHLGTWRVDLVLAGSCLLAPGLLLGIALSGARSPGRLSSALVGAALGTFAYAFLLHETAEPLSFEDLAGTSLVASRLSIAAWIAAGGALLVALGAPRAGARTAGALGALAFAAVPSSLAPHDPWLFSPWETPAIEPALTIDAPEGLLTVEPVRSNPTATLDRNRLTPAPWEENADADRIRRSLDLVDGTEGKPRVLFVGQLTPSRALAFERGEPVELEYTAAWYRYMELMDEALFAGSERRPPGTRVPLPEARRRLEAGEYDLVIVPPLLGRRLPSLPAQYESAQVPAPRSRGWSVPEGTIAVVWLDTASELGATDLRERVLVSTLPFEEPCIGLLVGDDPPTSGSVAGAGRTGVHTALATLRLRAYQRRYRARKRTFERLAEASVGTPDEEWMAALSAHYGAQTVSSPFGDWAQRIEITPEMLDHLRTAAEVDGELRPERRLFFEQIAKVLREVRAPDLVLEYLEPIARERGPWYELDLAVTAAYMEFDMEEEVAERLPALTAAAPYDISLLLMAADWEEDHGADAAALGYLRRAQEVQPGRLDVVRRLALLANRTGAEDAEVWLRRALELDPEDQELQELLESHP